jgi:hypothetical protein
VLFARIVIVDVPAAAELDALRVRVLEVTPFARLAGEKLPVTPLGAPSMLRSTFAVRPPPRATVIATVLLPLCWTDTDAGEMDRLSDGFDPPLFVPVGESDPPPPHAASTAAARITNVFRIEPLTRLVVWAESSVRWRSDVAPS